jgi:crotonobetaine/carnitine-CoA ligase
MLLQEVGGSGLTYREFHEGSLRWASLLSTLGACPGDPVAAVLDTSAPFFQAWIGAGWIGAFQVPLNTDLLGTALAFALNECRARVVIVERKYVPRLCQVAPDLAYVESVVVVGAGEPDVCFDPPLRVMYASAGLEKAEPVERPGPRPLDTHAGIFTSGTTGPSKCVLVTWSALEEGGRGILPGDTLLRGDRWASGAYYNPWPGCHMACLAGLAAAVQRGLRMVVRSRFSVNAYWDDIRAYGCTHSLLLVVAPLLFAEPARADDRDNPLVHVTMVPLIPQYRLFERRFGVKVATMYGSSEAGPVIATADPPNNRTCGRPNPAYEVRIVNGRDEPVDPGGAGELVVRTKVPGRVSTRYLGSTGETAPPWRNGWFHTGDVFTRDDEGNYYFVDRLKDSVRHRGHNVSSFEVEREVQQHPDVIDCACIGVPSDLADSDVFGDQEVKVLVTTRPGAQVTEEELVRFLIPRMPRFMVPRYVEIVERLPMTQTNKVRKSELRPAPRTCDMISEV